jgi:hypothetical protein
MTRYDVENYYSAIGKRDNLLIVSTTERIDEIADNINTLIREKNIATVNIEVIHKMENIQSYTLVSIHNGTCDMYSEKNKILSGGTILEVASYITNHMPAIITVPYTDYVDRIDDNDGIVIKNIKTGEEKTVDIDMINIAEMNILGVYLDNDGSVNIRPVNHISDEDMNDFIRLTEYIKDEGLRVFAQIGLRIIPDYVVTAPSGVDGYHYPADNVAEGGLKRRIINTVEMMRLLTSQDYAHIKFTDREIDMMITACIFCDAWHSGWQEDYDRNPSVRFEHPRIAAEALRSIHGIIPEGSKKFITNCIESHMGQKNKSTEDLSVKPLPVPDTEFKYTVHLANFLTKQQNIAFASGDKWFHYEEVKDNITWIPREAGLSRDDMVILQNALTEVIDHDKVVEAGIVDEKGRPLKPDMIKSIWRNILNARAVKPENMKFVELARTVTMF